MRKLFSKEAREPPMNNNHLEPNYEVAETVVGTGGFTFVVKSREFVQGMWSYRCAREGETEAIFTFPEVLLHKLDPPI